MAAINITASVTVAKIKPTSLRPLRSAMIVPRQNLSPGPYGRDKVQNALAANDPRGGWLILRWDGTGLPKNGFASARLRASEERLRFRLPMALGAARRRWRAAKTPIRRAGWFRCCGPAGCPIRGGLRRSAWFRSRLQN